MSLFIHGDPDGEWRLDARPRLGSARRSRARPARPSGRAWQSSRELNRCRDAWHQGHRIGGVRAAGAGRRRPRMTVVSSWVASANGCSLGTCRLHDCCHDDDKTDWPLPPFGSAHPLRDRPPPSGRFQQSLSRRPGNDGRPKSPVPLKMRVPPLSIKKVTRFPTWVSKVADRSLPRSLRYPTSQERYPTPPIVILADVCRRAGVHAGCPAGCSGSKSRGRLSKSFGQQDELVDGRSDRMADGVSGAAWDLACHLSNGFGATSICLPPLLPGVPQAK